MAQEEAQTQSEEAPVCVSQRTPVHVADVEQALQPMRHPLDRPVVKLSLRLIDTYKNVNKLYYERKARRQRKQSRSEPNRGGVHNNGYDDQNYDYIIQPGEVLAERYVLKNRIGKGSFGQVVVAYDRLADTEVAVKIIKSRKPFMVQAQTELELLLKLQAKDPDDKHNVVRLLDHFVFRNHQCLVFEMLSFNLYDLLRNTHFRGVSLNLVRKFAKHILRALQFLAREDVDIVHCDLKPENILLKYPNKSAVKVIDFGSSCYSSKRMYSYIQSRFYRSPEVLLGLPYDQQIDMWSLGCMLVEMHTGEPLFPGSDQEEQMARIIQTLGLPPTSMIEQAQDRVRELFFVEVMEEDPHTGEIVKVYHSRRLQSSKPPIPPTTLDDVIGVYTHGPQGRREKDQGHTVERYEEFRDLIARMLVFNPEERIKAADALRHPFFVNYETREAAAAAETDGARQAASSQRHASSHHGQHGSQRQRHVDSSSSNEAMAIQRTPQQIPRQPPHQNGTGPVPGPAMTTPPATLHTWSVSNSAHAPQHLAKASKPKPAAEPFAHKRQISHYEDMPSEKLVAGTFTTEYA